MDAITSGRCVAACKPSLGRLACCSVEEDQPASKPAGCIPGCASGQ